MQKQHVASDSRLQTGHQWSDQSHLFLFFFFLGTVSLQLQGRLAPISLRPVLGVWQFTSWLQSGHHVINFFHLVEVSVSTKWLKGYGSEYYL